MRLILLVLFASVSLSPSAALAQGPDERTLPREVAEEVLAAWNATGTLRVTGPHVIEAGREVSGDIAVLGGTLTIAGRIGGRVIGINANIALQPGARIDGGILLVGGGISGRESAVVNGDVRIYRGRLSYEREGDRLVARGDGGEPTGWWQRRERWRQGAWGDLRLVSARTYNRVEGLPLHLGPRIGRDFAWGRASLDAYGILRSADGFEWKSENLGHSVRGELQFGRERGVRVGGRLFDEVESVESWQLGDAEVGLASFFLHRDFRDYFNRKGSALSVSLFGTGDMTVKASYSDQRWRSRRTRDPWTLFRNEERWRQNPEMDDGRFHLLDATAAYDTRTDPDNPWSGWFVQASYEYGTGRIVSYAPTSPDTRLATQGGETSYDRLFLDVRRYNRLSPRTQLNMRLVGGGWLSGDDLPLQRRMSLGGPGTLPGYDFRRDMGGADVLTCQTTPLAGGGGIAGTPAQCERFLLAQLEYRSDLNLDPFGVLDEEREWRRSGWGRGTQWVVFSDIGRGWLVGDPDGELTYGKRAIPALSSFRADVGLGLVLDNVGIYVSRALTRAGHGTNVTLRLRPRF